MLLSWMRFPPYLASQSRVNKEGGEAMVMRRKGAKSIYELSTRPDKGPLLMENGVLEALFVLSEVRNQQVRLVISTVTCLSMFSRLKMTAQVLCI